VVESEARLRLNPRVVVSAIEGFLGAIEPGA